MLLQSFDDMALCKQFKEEVPDRQVRLQHRATHTWGACV